MDKFSETLLADNNITVYAALSGNGDNVIYLNVEVRDREVPFVVKVNDRAMFVNH